MSRVTKALAEEIAEKLISDKKEKYDEYIKETSNIARKYLMDNLPKEVVAFYKKFPNYCNTIENLSFNGNGCQFIYVNIEKTPYKEKIYQPIIVPTEEMGTLMEKRYNTAKDLESEYRKLKFSIIAALTQMRTFKKVSENFPEAIPYLPEKAESYVPSVDIKSIREKLKK